LSSAAKAFEKKDISNVQMADRKNVLRILKSCVVKSV
jgi:hypothetical protein